MQEIVSSIKRVADIINEISTASVEQNLGVGQINEAIIQLDHTTQQNAALVEESAAAALSLKRQAQELVSAVAVFKLADGQREANPPDVTPQAPALKLAAQTPRRPVTPLAHRRLVHS